MTDDITISRGLAVRLVDVILDKPGFHPPEVIRRTAMELAYLIPKTPPSRRGVQ